MKLQYRIGDSVAAKRGIEDFDHGDGRQNARELTPTKEQ